MNTQPFVRLSQESLIVLPCAIDNVPLSLALDTGASHAALFPPEKIMRGKKNRAILIVHYEYILYLPKICSASLRQASF